MDTTRRCKAAVPQASPADMWIGDDFHHNGAFRLSYGLEYAYRMESSKEVVSASSLIDRHDTYEWYLSLGPLSNVNAKYFHGKIMVQVQSTWFPVIDRNPQRFVPSIFSGEGVRLLHPIPHRDSGGRADPRRATSSA